MYGGFVGFQKFMLLKLGYQGYSFEEPTTHCGDVSTTVYDTIHRYTLHYHSCTLGCARSSASMSASASSSQPPIPPGVYSSQPALQ